MRTLLIFTLISVTAFGQELADTTYDKLYRNSYTVGIHFNTVGWGFYGELSKQKTYKYHHVLGLQFSNIRHKNEFKTSTIDAASSFFYYKINSLVAMRPTFGGNLRLFEIRRENGVEIMFKWKLGPSLGLLKPVYLDIRSMTSNTGPRVERYDPEVHGYSVIESKASWFTGLGESKVEIGAHFKSGFNFNFANQKSGISGGEIGFLFDYFPFREVDLMYEADNYKLFTAFYLQFELGNRF